MKAAVISCSKKKVPGGIVEYKTPFLAEILGNEGYGGLLRLRNELFTELGLPAGPDSVGGEDPRGLEFLPAYERYSGTVYQAAGVREGLPGFGGRLFIISALYGLLEAHDPIRNYDLCMKDKVPCGDTVMKWWRDKGLHTFIEAALRNTDADEAHDFLGGDYRKVVSGYASNVSCKVVAHEYPGKGSFSQYLRAKDIERIMSK